MRKLVAKRLGLLRELVPQAPTSRCCLTTAIRTQSRSPPRLREAAASLGVQLNVLEATATAEIEKAYASLKPGSPLLIGTDPSSSRAAPC